MQVMSEIVLCEWNVFNCSFCSELKRHSQLNFGLHKPICVFM